MTEKVWRYKAEPDTKLVQKLSEEIGVSLTQAKLFAQRGLKNFEQAKTFFNPSLEDLHEPGLMADLNMARDRILSAIQNGESVLVFGDYDVDGTTAVTLMASFLRRHSANVFTYIPDRYKEGYGLSLKGLEYAKSNNCKVVIALDCGIKSLDLALKAKALGLDLIICDHHEPGPQIPDAYAVLDPKRKDCNYPYKELSGCGVGFKLCQAVQTQMGLPVEGVFDLLDLLAVSIGADIVPITGENRILAFHGMKKINQNPRPAFASIMATMNRSPFTITDVVFTIAPRINAAGRIDHGHLAVDFLSSESEIEANQFLKTINDHNTSRKNFDSAITQEALEMISDLGEENLETTVVYQPEWHKGVIGIVASRLIENYYRPTIVFTKSKGVLAGSARSVFGFDVYKALEACANELIQFGGHMYAAGMTLAEENFEAFKARFNEVVSSTILPEQKIPRIEVDCEISFDEIDQKFFNVLKRMEPFGPQNLNPIFVSKGLVCQAQDMRAVGGDESHLKIRLTCPETGLFFDGIAFGMASKIPALQAADKIEVAYHLDENVWNGNRNLQLMIQDIKPES